MVSALSYQLNTKCCARLFKTIVIDLKSRNSDAATKAEMVVKYFKIGQLSNEMLISKQQQTPQVVLIQAATTPNY